VNGLTLMAGAAVVGALATSRWQEVRSAVTGRLRAGNAWDDHGTLDQFVMESRRIIDAARQTGDQTAEQRLADDWARRLQIFLMTEPGLDAELRGVVFNVLLPVLPRREQVRVIQIEITAPRDQVISHNFLRSQDRIVR
jgi:hypothetical protein